MARPVSSTPSRRGLLIAATALLIVAAALAAWLVPQDRDSASTRTGHALDGGVASQAELQYSNLRVGKEYWLSLPQATNISGEPVTVLKAQFVGLPDGLELVGYKAVSVEDTDGYGVGVLPVKGTADDVSGLPDRSGTPFTVKSHQPAEVYYTARIKATGPVTGDTSRCRFWYRQGSVQYRQDLRCVNQLRLAGR
ncbi:hypothetical protein [Streptomyces sp. NPDC050528]|uniref:hypothetical protein n=1 Tax=unclassified Streptomyces TaxID=2593676 RepID=UPI00379647C9